MSTISKLNRFVMNPTSLDISRSKFNRPFTHKTTFKSGDLVPIYYDEVLPGDTFQVDFSTVVRELTPAVPVMDNAFLDVYFFFVPNRISCLGEHDWAKICGENFSSFWANDEEYTLENTGNMFTLDDLYEAHGEIESGSVFNYMGLPILDFSQSEWTENQANRESVKISKMPFVSYIKIWNEFFRDQNVQSPITDYDFCILEFLPGNCLKVNKYHDYFTSALPSPQKSINNMPVLVPLGDSAPIQFATKQSASSNEFGPFDSVQVSSGTSNMSYKTLANFDALDDSTIQFPAVGMVADLSNATGATINQLRQAFAIQRALEKDARGGSRYRESLAVHFGVTLPDYTAQVPQYLAGKRIPLNITQVLQTSETSQDSPLGATGAFGNTAFSDSMFIKSFVEYGQILGVACVRTSQSYSQGIPKFFGRSRRFDWYYPVFANLGEQQIKRTELYIPQNGETADSLDKLGNVFGYQEAWAEYRYHPDLVTGNLAPNSGDLSLVPWTYTNNFNNWPVLNNDFMVQPSSQIGDTLVVDSETQFLGDFLFNVTTTRPMPLYSIPGLIDHH